MIGFDAMREWVTLGVALAVWLLIHPFVRTWRRIGPLRTGLVFLGLTLVYDWLVWQARERLLAVEFGVGMAPVGLGVMCVSVWLFAAIRRGTQPKLGFLGILGLPEYGAQDGSRRLLREGAYARSRNPRYMATLVAILGCALFANSLAGYVYFLLGLPALRVVLLEERELAQAFGQEYLDYCARVPRYIPSWPG